MKNKGPKLIALILMFTIVGLTSCKKEQTEEPASTDAKLLKINSWNPSTNVEGASSLELTYEAGKVKTIITNRVNLAVTYGSNGKVSLVKGLNSIGGEVSYTINYNAAGQIAQIVYVYMNPKDFGNTQTFEYSAVGKVIKTTSLGAGASAGSVASIVEYTWNGDNIETAKTTNGAIVYTYTYSGYDTKINPYSLGDGIAAIINGAPASKNNYTAVAYVNSNTTSNQKRSYEYNSAGYTTSMKLLDGSNEGNKFYYDK